MDIYTSTQERKWQWPGMMFTVSHTGVTYRYIYTYRYDTNRYIQIIRLQIQIQNDTYTRYRTRWRDITKQKS